MYRTALAWLAVTAVACSSNPEGGEPQIARQTAALTVSETPIGTEAPLAIQYDTGNYLSVASSGNEHLVVFYDGGLIRGVRYDASGTVLDLDPWILLGRNDDGEGSQAYTDVAYGNGVYMVVYADGSPVSPGLYVQGVDPKGAPLGAPQLIHPGSFYGAVTFNGTDFTVAYCDGNIGLTRVGLDGRVLEETKTAVTTGGGTNRPSLAMAKDVGLIVFERAAGGGAPKVYAARFTPEGDVLDPGGLPISDATTGSVDVSVAAGTSEFLAVWGGSVPGAVYGSFVGADGSVRKKEFAISSGSEAMGGSAVAFDGTQYLVVWEDQSGGENELLGTRLSAAGDPLDRPPIRLATGTRAYQSWELDLAWTGSHFALAYKAVGIEGLLLDSGLSARDSGPLHLTPLPSAQYLSAVTFDGEAYVVAFSHESGELSEQQLKSVRIDTNGKLVGAEAELIATPSDGAFVSGLALAASQESTLYAYESSAQTTTTFLRVRPTGGALSAPTPLPDFPGSGLRLASNGKNYLGIFDAGKNANGNPTELWGQRFSGAGAREGDPFLVKAIERPRASLFATDEGYLLVYSGQELAGTPITGSVIGLTANGEESRDYGPVVEGMQSAVAACHGPKCLFVWEDVETVFARLLDPARLLDHASAWTDAFPVSEAPASGGAAVGFDGTEFVVVWPEGRAALWARNVTLDGGKGALQRLFQGDFVSPSLTPGSDGQLLLSYVRYTDGSRSRRVESRLIGKLGTPPENPASGVGGGTPASVTLSGAGGATGGAPSAAGATTASVGGAASAGGNRGLGGDSADAAGTGGLRTEPKPESPPGDSDAEAGCTFSAPGSAPRSLWLVSLLVLTAGSRRRRSSKATTSLPKSPAPRTTRRPFWSQCQRVLPNPPRDGRHTKTL